MAGAQDIVADPRNEAVLVWINGRLVPREQATVSVFDGGYIAGDGVWEGLRLHRGRLLFLGEHLDRLCRGAAAIDLEIGRDRAGLVAALQEVCHANDMTDGVHLRLMVTRGIKSTPSQDPRQAIGPATIVIIAEHKVPPPALAATGLSLLTSSIRTTRPDQFDMRLNSHSRLNLVTALIQAYRAGADEALMLDDAGHVASCNSTNFFAVRDGAVLTSGELACFNGITRAKVIGLCREAGIAIRVGPFGMLDVAAAEEAFVTGTFGGVTPVRAIDFRPLSVPGPVTVQIAGLYRALIDR